MFIKGLNYIDGLLWFYTTVSLKVLLIIKQTKVDAKWPLIRIYKSSLNKVLGANLNVRDKTRRVYK